MAEVKTIKINVDTKQAVNAMDDLAKSTHDVSASFEEVYGDIQPLTARMGEAEDRLYELANAGKTTTKEYKDLLKTVGNYRKVQIQTDMVVDAAATTMGQKLGGALGGVTAGFSLAQGVMGAFGVESEELERVLLRVQAALAIQQGFQGIRESLPYLTDLKNTAIDAFKGMTVASRAFMTAGIGILIVGIGLLIENFDKIANVFTGEIERNARYTKALNQSAKAIKDNAKELDKRADDLKRNQDFEYAMAEAQGATTAELRKMKVAQAEERIELEKDSVARAENIYWLAKQRYQKLINLEADEELIKKAKENAVKARETLTKEKEDLQQARQDRKDIINQNKVDEVKDRQDRIKAGQDAAKTQADLQKQELEKLAEYNKASTDLFRSEYEKQVEAIKKKYDEQIALAKKYNKDYKDLEAAQAKELEDALDKSMVKIETLSIAKTQIAERDLGGLRGSINTELQAKQEAADLEISILEAKASRAARIEEQSNSFKVKATLDGLSAIASISELFGKKSEKAAKRAFQVQKAANIATALITTYQNATSAYASQFTPIPTPDSPIRGAIAAGIAVASGLANVAKIGQQKFEGGTPVSDSGGGGGSIPSITPSFNVVGNSGVNQLAQLQQQPVQAFVVSGSVTTAQSLDRNRIENATL